MTDIARHLEAQVSRLLTLFPVVMLVGARQTEKTTLSRMGRVLAMPVHAKIMLVKSFSIVIATREGCKLIIAHRVYQTITVSALRLHLQTFAAVLIPDKPFLQNLLSSGILQLPAFLYLRFRILRFPGDNWLIWLNSHFYLRWSHLDARKIRRHF